MDFAAISRRSAHGRGLADLRLVTVADGPGTGGRLLELRTPAGLAADIALDRGGDLLRVNWRGREVGWHSAALAPHPWPDAEAEHGLGFLRGFDGFLVTCGLDHHGVPAETSAEAARYPLRDVHVHPLHGRIATSRAELVQKRIDWAAGEIVLDLVMRQTTVFGENLELARRYSVALERGEIVISDRVTNRGFRPARHGLLYHVNVGHPVLGETARLIGDDWPLADRLAEGAAPADDHVEVVEAGPSPDGGRIGVTGAGIALTLDYDPARLPVTALWRAFQSGTFALGLEPQTDLSDPGQAVLAAGEARDYSLAVSLTDAEATADR
ncbi:MAG: aldose 1-epimerase family protein [Pseudomonadota bacterium]